MLDHLRQRVIDTLASVGSVTLSSCGPAELQASLLPCEAAGLHLYLLLPATSDHLLNLETQPDVVLNTADWQLRGVATVLEPTAYPPDLALLSSAAAQWGRLVLVRSTRLHIRRRNGWSYSETIDIDEEA